MTAPTRTPIIILVGGHWLGSWAWDEVLAELSVAPAAPATPTAPAAPTALAITLPGFDADDALRTTRTLDEQATALADLLAEHSDRSVVLVAHSGANAPVSMVLDRHPERVARMVWVDSGPVAPGTVFDPDFPDNAAESPLPPFAVLGQQASLAGLSDTALERFRARAVPVPGSVLRQPVPLSNVARRDVPTTLICCSLPSAQLRELAQTGHPMFAETAKLTGVEFLDLPTGHWPMWSEPNQLALLLRAEAARVR
ncbi:putative esterase [Leucobacter sp. 7(1)]|uniref:alpha/beta fold hydrolase n=1 Tax=Leucobacter sp. 7(1) TaxID=1255613 RepID=UPI00097F4070|nr:alpha/beta fold hydrolase [Leucobacter sp. 7(1)]SJN11327.1 putative esterase [Leucobacter sp. 7(1)]